MFVSNTRAWKCFSYVLIVEGSRLSVREPMCIHQVLYGHISGLHSHVSCVVVKHPICQTGVHLVFKRLMLILAFNGCCRYY
jgi:hypothetical protein